MLGWLGPALLGGILGVAGLFAFGWLFDEPVFESWILLSALLGAELGVLKHGGLV
jgi:hypothetical protein